jgi:uncharacterized YceG family protein
MPALRQEGSRESVSPRSPQDGELEPTDWSSESWSTGAAATGVPVPRYGPESTHERTSSWATPPDNMYADPAQPHLAQGQYTAANDYPPYQPGDANLYGGGQQYGNAQHYEAAQQYPPVDPYAPDPYVADPYAADPYAASAYAPDAYAPAEYAPAEYAPAEYAPAPQYGEQVPAPEIDADEHSEFDAFDDPDYLDQPETQGGKQSRKARRAAGRRHRRRRRLIGFFALIVIATVGVAGWMVVGRAITDLRTKDYSGVGTGTVTVQIKNGDTTTAIGDTLAKAGVVASSKAFVEAAKKNPNATSLQPGVYAVHSKMSGAAALTLLLDPTSRKVSKFTIPEGYSDQQVIAVLVDKVGLDRDAVVKALADLPSLALPTGFSPTSAEGFLFPATYDVNPGTSAADVIKLMTTAFSAQINQLGFVAAAGKLGVSAYQALSVASMAEAEATNYDDWTKITRVIYNRIAQGMPLGIDSTSAYEARLQGKDPNNIDYNVDTPYNTRRVARFPPTPIGNPGADTLKAAVNPAAGDWLYYVQSDAKGSLSFFSDYKAFQTAAALCAKNKWGNC